MRFIMTAGDERTHAPKPQTDERPTPTTYKTRSTPQTRRRNDLPDTKTIRISKLDDATMLANKILDPDPNRKLHYATPTLKRRILR